MQDPVGCVEDMHLSDAYTVMLGDNNDLPTEAKLGEKRVAGFLNVILATAALRRCSSAAATVTIVKQATSFQLNMDRRAACLEVGIWERAAETEWTREVTDFKRRPPSSTYLFRDGGGCLWPSTELAEEPSTHHRKEPNVREFSYRTDSSELRWRRDRYWMSMIEPPKRKYLNPSILLTRVRSADAHYILQVPNRLKLWTTDEGKQERERLKEARRSEAQSLHRISDGKLPGFARVVYPTDRSGEFER
ncbi:hypothetical protein BDP67DRAFT_484490 [Colletotrichum lupini]|nr:hypothetical protein BDP67DRAFT_484490 [Colletotrichum lupini]